MSFRKLILASAILVGYFDVAAGDEIRESQDLNRFFDTNTIAYVRADLNRLNVDTTIEVASQFLPEGSEWTPWLRSTGVSAGRIISQLKRAGATEIFLILSLSDFPDWGPYGVIRVSDETKRAGVKAIVEELIAGQRLECIAFDEGLFVGKQAVWNRIENRSLPTRGDVMSFLKASEEHAASLVVSPSAEHRTAIRQILPSLPDPFSQVTGDSIADGARLLRLTLDFADKPTLQLQVKGDDAAANGQLARGLGKFVDGLVSGEIELPPPLGDSFSQLPAGLVQIKSEENQFSARFDDQQLDRLARAARPLVKQVENRNQDLRRANQIRQLALAMHNYHDGTKALPAYASFDDSGKPLLSWRVHILPFLEGNDLYNQFRLDEPWDSEHNRQLIEKIPDIYVTADSLRAEGKTIYVVPRGEQVIGQIPRLSLEKITDGSSRTILIIEADPDSAVIWTKPDDWEVDLENPKQGLFSQRQTTARAAFADGSVHRLTDAISAEVLKALLTVDGKELVDTSEFNDN